MLSNEEDTNIAYERMNSRVAESSDAKIATIVANGLNDERKGGCKSLTQVIDGIVYRNIIRLSSTK
jgi:hypothetical protein